jgi:DNA-binding response OmpR family regulator
MTETDDTRSEKVSPLVLIVDDTRITADIDRNFFVLSGFRVLVAATLDEVLDLVKSSPIDLVMVDLAFAKDKGLELVQEVRRVSCYAGMKVMVTSISASAEARNKAIKAGADVFLTKPAPRQKVLKEIKALTSLTARDSERVRQSLLVSLSIGGKGQPGAHSLDISEDGIHLAGAGEKPAVGQVLEMKIDVGDAEVSVSGTVVRHTPEGFGVRFSELGRNAKRALDKFILAHSMEEKASRYYL